jgi:hypothetical protein
VVVALAAFGEHGLTPDILHSHSSRRSGPAAPPYRRKLTAFAPRRTRSGKP